MALTKSVISSIFYEAVRDIQVVNNIKFKWLTLNSLSNLIGQLFFFLSYKEKEEIILILIIFLSIKNSYLIYQTKNIDPSFF